MNTLDKQYIDLLHAINEYGVVKKDRTGTGTRSIFGYTIRHNMKDGFPLLTTKKMHWKSIVIELLWFLRGDTNIKYLVDNGCNIWNGDAYKNYLQNADYKGMPQAEFIQWIKMDKAFAEEWGDLGPIYGKQWRSWSTYPSDYLTNPIDQIQNLINDLKTNPDSRRLMVSAWNVGELDQMVLPPCHYGFQVYTRELSENERYVKLVELTNRPLFFLDYGDGKTKMKEFMKECDKLNIPTRAISLMWNQRSVDTFLGLPFNIASYGLLLEIIAKAVNMVPDQLIGNLGDTHLYLNHADAVEEQLGRYYSPDERAQLLKEAMGEDAYSTAVSELMPFGGGLSEYYASYKIPYRTREPFKLPKLVINDEFWNPDVGLIEQIEHIEISDFEIRDYQSHPTIKAPLSN
jgi:thymidylate synthase